jgi:hypothetical protein
MSLLLEPFGSETVERPASGLAAGRWEAPAWFFYAVAIAAIVGGLAWALVALRAKRSEK